MISVSLWFSTTMTWNWRGSSTIATTESSVMVTNVLITGSVVSTAAVSGRFIASVNIATGPSNMKYVTKMPTVRKQTSLITDSAAIARIMPS